MRISGCSVGRQAHIMATPTSTALHIAVLTTTIRESAYKVDEEEQSGDKKRKRRKKDGVTYRLYPTRVLC